jgi:hypothetical protein
MYFVDVKTEGNATMFHYVGGSNLVYTELLLMTDVRSNNGEVMSDVNKRCKIYALCSYQEEGQRRLMRF